MCVSRAFYKLRIKAKDHTDTVDSLIDGNSEQNGSLLYVLVQKCFIFSYFAS